MKDKETVFVLKDIKDILDKPLPPLLRVHDKTIPTDEIWHVPVDKDIGFDNLTVEGRFRVKGTVDIYGSLNVIGEVDIIGTVNEGV